MALPDSFLDELVARSDIVEVVQHYVPLKKSGSNYFGLCPFHNERSPSFSVSPDKQIFYCFGCGEGGGVIQFIMKIEGLPFLDAVRLLADRAGMEMPTDREQSDEQRRARERMLSMNRDAARWFHTLLQQPQGEQAQAYFVRRGLSKRTVTSFGLGWAENSWDSLLKHLTGLGYRPAEIEKAGLAVRGSGGGLYDRFRGRVMFPIIDVRGNVIGFGGRVLDDSKPKYLNSPDTLVFHKNRNLFALNLAKKSRQGRLILAEGYMDVIALHQAGFDCAVASLGTALTDEQAKLMTRYTKEVVICYDSDEAGQKAAQRAIDILNRAGMEVRVLRIPGAKDPDEYIRENGSEAFGLLLRKPQTDGEYRVAQLAAQYDLTQDDGRIAFLKAAVPMLAAMPNRIEREIYARSAAQMAGLSENAVLTEVARASARGERRKKQDTERRALQPLRQVQPHERELRYQNPRSALCEEKLLALVLQDQDLLDQAREKVSPDAFSSDFLAKIYQKAIERREQGLELSAAACMAGLPEGEVRHLSGVLAESVRSREPEREMDDYISTILSEYEKRTEPDGDDLLRKAASRRRSKEGG